MGYNGHWTFEQHCSSVRGGCKIFFSAFLWWLVGLTVLSKCGMCTCRTQVSLQSTMIYSSVMTIASILLRHFIIYGIIKRKQP
ncbi:hypothetical protein FB192DRAFT_1376871 [Mucor lusitanicus]|uniref:Uncharacterized protein n=1 Tax=Mucor circinelloides f. lusitanicus TaxID=29924 RepID=A0A8H4F372_MUCCL|nr:hypothetical protein FB192DRAFT_1376871 [Mucor lusitanicus]